MKLPATCPTICEPGSEIPWQDLADLRNVLTHEYFGVDLGLLWNAVTEELSPLVSALERILASPD